MRMLTWMKVSRATKRRVSTTVLATFGALWLPSAPAPATGSVVHEKGCTVVIAQPGVPVERVRPLVPDRFTLSETRIPPDLHPEDPLNLQQATVGPFAVHCEEVSVNGGPPRETTWVAFRVTLAGEPEDFEQPEQGGSPLGDPLIHLDDYQFFIASDNPEIIDLFRREAGVTDRQAVYVKHLVFDLDLDSGTFFLDAPAPTPSPFQIHARVGTPLVGPADISVHHWGSGPHGVWNVIDPDGGPDRIRDLRFGPASGTIRPEPGSEMAEIFCSTDVKFDDPFAGTVSFPPNEFVLQMVDRPERPAGPIPRAAECQ